MANEEHLALLQQSIPEWNEWRKPTKGNSPDLNGANLIGADLKGADLSRTDLRGVDLRRADLRRADLREADLRRADLREADFRHANLSVADLRKLDLTEARLNGADLREADLRGAILEGQKCKGANFTAAIANAETMGVESLTKKQRENFLTPFMADASATPPSTSENVQITMQGSGRRQITIVTASRVVSTLHQVLDELTFRNDWNDVGPGHHDLYIELKSTIADLRDRLAQAEFENRQLSEANADLRRAVNEAEPLLKRAWETFVLDAVKVASKGPTLSIGFIAGMSAGTALAALTGQPLNCSV